MMISSFFGSNFGATATKKKVAKKKVVKKPVKKVKAPTLAQKQAAARVMQNAVAAITHTATATHAAVAQQVAATAPAGADPLRLQADLVTLGKIVKSSTLEAVKVDGAPGAKTVAAVNLALKFCVSQTIGQPGSITLAFVKKHSGLLADTIEIEIRRRGGTVVPPSLVAGAKAAAKASKHLKAVQAAAARKAAAAQKLAAAKARLKAAKAKAIAAKQQAAALRAKAAALRATNPMAANMLTQQADMLDAVATEQDSTVTQANAEAATATAEATHAAVDEGTATQAAAAAAKEETTPSASDAAAAGMTPASGGDGGGAETPSTALVPSEGGGFFAQNKIAIGVGAVAVLGIVAAIMLKKKKPGLTTNI